MSTAIINGQVVTVEPLTRPARVVADPQPPLPLAIMRAIAAKRGEIMAEYKEAVALIKQGYDEDEIKSWPKQEEQARKFLEGETPFFLANLAAERGISTQALADKILEKVAAYELSFSTALGRRDFRLKQLAEATTIEEINSV